MPSKKPALGRGLDALLSRTEVDQNADRPGLEHSRGLYDFDDRTRLLGRVADIETAHIRRNPYQPRENFEEQALNELAASIRQLGIIQPLTVRAVGHGQFELISGERRLRAATMAGLDRVPAFVREADDERMLEMALVENVQREELDPIEVAMGFQRLIEECHLTQETVATRIGKTRSSVTNTLRLLQLPATVQQSLRAKRISVGHARALLSLDNTLDQESLLNEIEAEQLSVRQVEQRVKSFQSKKTAKSKSKTAPSIRTATPTRDRLQIQAFTDLLRAHYGTQVQVRHQASDGTGRVEISYYSLDDLERLMELLVK